MAAIPESTRNSITLRLLDHAERHWPQLTRVQVTYRGAFGYITGVLRDGQLIPLCRLRYGGSAHSFGFAIYSAASNRYQDAVLRTGLPTCTPQEVLDTRIALRRGVQSLRYAMNTLADAVSDDSHPAVQHLTAAAGFLAAGRDLLQTHFATGPGGAGEPRSYWAPVITSRPVTAALLGEIAGYALRLAPWTARLSVPETTERDVPAA